MCARATSVEGPVRLRLARANRFVSIASHATRGLGGDCDSQCQQLSAMYGGVGHYKAVQLNIACRDGSASRLCCNTSCNSVFGFFVGTATGEARATRRSRLATRTLRLTARTYLYNLGIDTAECRPPADKPQTPARPSRLGRAV